MELPTPQLRVERWPDSVIDHLGFGPRSPYADLWLGILGPSTVCAWRLLSSRLERAGNGFDVDLVEMARLLGLGTGVGRNSPMGRTLERATRFEIAQWRADKTVLAVRLRIPPLPRRHVLRLPLVAQQAHEAWLTASNRRPGQNPGPVTGGATKRSVA